MGKTKSKPGDLEVPRRLTGVLSKWVDRAESGEAQGVKRPARVAAELVEWVLKADDRELRSALDSVGVEMFERRPEHHYVSEYYGRGAEKLISGLDDEEFMAMASEVREQKRTYLHFNRLYTLYQAVRNIARRFPAGELGFLEAGVFRGGSAYFVARAAERYAGGRATLTAVDTFEGHSAEDLPGGQEGAHEVAKFSGTTFEDVRDYLSPFPFVDVVQGRIQDVAPSLEQQALHLVHADVDIYAPTRFTLELALDRLVPGGIVIVDDYGFTTCPGARQALDEFIAEHGEPFVLHKLDSGQALLIRMA